MGALDRLENLNVNRSLGKTTVNETFDIFDALQTNGFLMYDEYGKETELCKVLKTEGNNYIQAIAGSGKTTALVLKIIYDINSGELMQSRTLENGMQVKVMDKVFVGTFLKSGAEELQQRVMSMQNKLGLQASSSQASTQISFGTLHAEFKRALNAMGVNTPIGQSTVLKNLFKRAVNDCGITRANSNSMSNEDYTILEGIFTYFRGRLDDKRAEHTDADDYNLSLERLEFLARRYKQLKEEQGVMDFEDLQELLYKFCYVTPNENVINFLANRYNYMYLDEFQDTSQIQYALLRVYMRDVSKQATTPKKGKITVVGDVQQCIYSFRGSDINVMYREFDKDFNSTHNNLSYNRRCPSEILNPIIPSIMLNEESKNIEIKASKEGGEFHCYGVKNETTMLQLLKRGIEEDIKKGYSIAILCRTNYDGLVPAFYVASNKIRGYSISNDSMTLSGALARKLIYVSHIFSARGGNAIKGALSLFTPLYQQNGVVQLANAMKQNNQSLWDIPLSDIEYSCGKELADYVEQWHTFRSISNDVDVLKAIYWQLHDDVFGSSDTSYANNARAILDVLLHLLNSKEYSSVAEFREDIALIDEEMKSCMKVNNPNITITTVHEYKGKEADSVYVWNDTRGIFPTTKARISNKAELEEERRVHYIACTRARKKSTILGIKSRMGLFVKEMNCTIEDAVISKES